MKRIEAMVRPERVDAVKTALSDIGHRGVTVYEAKGHGVQGGVTQKWRGEPYTVDLLPKCVVVAVVNDHEAPEAVNVIVTAARTGRMGDGKVVVTPVDEVVRIRTGESGTAAL